MNFERTLGLLTICRSHPHIKFSRVFLFHNVLELIEAIFSSQHGIFAVPLAATPPLLFKKLKLVLNTGTQSTATSLQIDMLVLQDFQL